MATNHTHAMDLDTWPSVREGLPGRRDFKDPFSICEANAFPHDTSRTD